jgi:hemolysin activation/secretion protein
MHPDREVKAVIVPGQEVGTSDLLLDVKDQRPIHVGGEINNFGTELTGRERYNVNVRHTNLLGVDDIFASRVQFGEEVFGIGLQHVLPVGPYGTQAGWTFNYTDVNVGGDFSALDIAGEAYTGSVFFSHPLRDGDHIDITGTASAESKSIYNTVLGAPSSEDQLRMLHAGANLDIIDRYGRSFIVNDLTFGTPWLDASDKNDPTLSRRGAGASFFKYDASFNRIHPVYDQTYLYMKGSAQVTADKLVSAEQYDIGGAYSVRGYPQSDYLGDSGFGGSLELRIPWFFLPHETKVPHTNVALWDRIHFIGFVDGAYATLRSPTVGEDRSKNYAGAGGGLRIDLPNNFLARLEWAAPVGDDPTDGSNGQFYFTVSSDFV